MARQASTVTVNDILASHSAEVVEICERLRAIVRAVMPEVIERAYPGWHAVGFRHPKAGYVCGAFPFDNYVQFVFEHGVELRDPDGLLTGSGKQVRYLDIKPGDPVNEGGLAALIHEAVALRS